MRTRADSSLPVTPQCGEAEPLSARKPRFALAIAAVGGLGYLPKMPGTWGSLAGLALYLLTEVHLRPQGISLATGLEIRSVFLSWITIAVAILIAAFGVWSSYRVAGFTQRKDPQFIVIDEVSGQYLTCLLSLAWVNWKYLLLGFILFRAFDIWKPFPARQAESLPAGWGIMADDWIAAIYAAIALWIAKSIGL